MPLRNALNSSAIRREGIRVGMSRTSSCLVAIFCATVLGCSGSNRPQVSISTQWSLDSSAAVRIAGTRNDGSVRFSGIIGGTRINDRSIVIGDQSTNSVKFFDYSGNLVSVVRPAEDDTVVRGNLRRLSRCPGTNSIVAEDIGHQQFIFISDQGVITRRVHLAQDLIFAQLLYCAADGSLLALLSEPQTKASGGRVVHSEAALVSVSRNGGTADTIRLVGNGEFYFARNVPVYFELPLGSAVRAVFSNELGYIGRTTDDKITIVDARGATRSTFSLGIESRSAQVRDLLAAISSRASEEPELDLRRLLRLGMAEAPLSSSLPEYSRLITDRLGNLWIRTSVLGATTASWSVRSPVGSRLASIDMPFRFRPIEIGADYILGLERPREDSESVVLFGLVKGD